MKKLILITVLLFGISQFGYSQLFNLKDKVKNEATDRAENKTDNAVDKTFDKIESGIGSFFGKGKKKKKDKKKQQKENNSEQNQNNANNSQVENTSPNVNWAKYDFVAGDEIIFEDDFVDEENGEFPSRWDLVTGQVENAEVDGKMMAMFIDGSPKIIPFMKNAKEDYLPDVFTVEFDIYKPKGSNRIFLDLYDEKNQRAGENKEITIGYNYISIGDIEGKYPKELSRDIGRWIHISLAYTRGKLKIYMDDTRLINIPRYQGNPTGISIQCYFADAKHLYYLKNLRIAKGGVKYYDRVIQDGKIICKGIRFDTGKATLLPESMGSINNIYKLMQKKKDIKFSVEGHTDSDGDNNQNQNLSEARAETVKKKLIEMGIEASRLSSKGWGETMPIAENNTTEGKANNRRVEFVRINK